MQKLVFAAVSRNYFNMPVWIAEHQGMFADEGLDAGADRNQLADPGCPQSRQVVGR
jgi:hypothetical protein